MHKDQSLGRQDLLIKHLGQTDYAETLELMQSWTNKRTPTTPDECWITEHPPVFTLGQSAAKLHSTDKLHGIPLVKSDRGGQITYHGPGQIILYLLIDLHRSSIKIKELVNKSEDLVIKFLRPHSINAHRRPAMPGVYVDDIKVSSIGYKIRHGRSYHGISINYSMDMRPFSLIDVCGYADLQATDLRSLGLAISYEQAVAELEQLLTQLFIES
ncbi:MAG: lipoyl(octanoyl) transferase LipB [Candidatus Portiera sp.]|nr:lipoyl(octanoyl) transferase LipB [Portiera sp.]